MNIDEKCKKARQSALFDVKYNDFHQCIGNSHHLDQNRCQMLIRKTAFLALFRFFVVNSIKRMIFFATPSQSQHSSQRLFAVLQQQKCNECNMRALNSRPSVRATITAVFIPSYVSPARSLLVVVFAFVLLLMRLNIKQTVTLTFRSIV